MFQRMLLAMVMLAVFFAPAVGAVNMSGTWATQNEGFYVKLRQSGDLVTGKTFQSAAAVVRGAWSGDQLVLSIFETGYTDQCRRDTLVVTGGGTVRAMKAQWFHSDGATPTDSFGRTSSDAGEAVEYPYADELKLCGDLLSYELMFDVNSDVLKGSDWPILSAVANLLKQDPSLKFRVIGHTDSTGDAKKNKDLSLRRAEAVRKKIVELSGADAGRVQIEGMGPDQPLQDNGTPAGRAVNRRVEIAIQH